MAGELSTVLVTPEHLIRAEVQTAGRRLLEIVNDRSTDFLRVQDAAVFRRECGSFVAKAPSAVIRKSNVAMFAPEARRHEAPQKRCDNFVAKRDVETFLVVLGYEVYGKLHLKGTDDPVSLLSYELTGFFPVSDAKVCFQGTRSTGEASPVVIVNAPFVSLCRIGNFTEAGAEAPVSVEAVQSPPLATPAFGD